MATKKGNAKPKGKKTPSNKSKSDPQKSVRRKATKPESATVQPRPQVKAQIIDEKSLRTISQLTGFLGVGVLFSAIALAVQLWATVKAKVAFTIGSILYIIISLVLIAVLVWCIRLLNQKRVLSIWVFIGFLATYIVYTLAFRWFDGKALFISRDFITWIVLAGILFELFRLKRKVELSQAQ